jgi:hypothetical protein
MTYDRRTFLRAACGCCSVGLLPTLSSFAAAPANLVKSISGILTVNDVVVKPGHPLNYGDRLATGRDSSAVVTFNQDAFQLRPLTQFKLPARDEANPTLALESGSLLGAFLPGGKRQVKVKTFTTLSIRGTGIYLGIQDDFADFCLCYGAAAVQTATSQTEIDTKSGFHRGLFIQKDGVIRRPGTGEQPNTHSNRQNIELERLVGRPSPYAGGFRDWLSTFESSTL